MAGIYIHIPFCKQACHYCDFHFSTNLQLKEQMVRALVSEIELQKDFLQGEEINTIYLGGGTPSLLSGAELELLMQTLSRLHTLDPAAEITLEANPDDLTSHNLKVLKNAGINRLSIGIQSFQDDLLKFLNRVHSADTALSTYWAAREAGFDNISMDLIYAIPGQDDLKWEGDIRQALALNPEHISCYALTIEEKTVFGRWSATGKLKPTADDLAAQQLELLMSRLEQAGYEHYEVSNFSKPGFHSRHNSSYWKQELYLGIGPGAHSYNRTSRHFSVRNNHLYIKAIQAGTVPAEVEILTPENMINEYILTTLRTQWGTNLVNLKAAYGYDLFKQNSEYIQELIYKGMATLNQDTLTLTRKGILLADKIASDLLVLEV